MEIYVAQPYNKHVINDTETSSFTDRVMGKRGIMNFTENLRALREKDGITQEQLAERMEVSRQTISKWESGASMP